MFIERLLNRRPSRPLLRASGETPVRSLVKALSWRVTGSLDTMFLSWIFTQEVSVAVAIGLTEVFTKMLLYYGHERLWNRISLGREPVSGGGISPYPTS